MKVAGVFALRILALTPVLIFVFTIASNETGLAQVPLPSAQAASTPTAQAQPAASSGSIDFFVDFAGLRKKTNNQRKKA